MKKFKVVWSIQLSKDVSADNVKEAVHIIENGDCQHDGNYVEDSFQVTYIQEYIPLKRRSAKDRKKYIKDHELRNKK